ncbi:acetate/propionate family kinase [Rhodovastum atsumiense]|uniref:Acetate kinase n=2 Tax=Rhodovastum atsumiense TaxID=504468 RepID=A0A5M6ILS3_9PROT|nr:acetate/propionate family kinase [Rhodovastum atsumiense]KAA5609226.1 acetate/propionate family kinase [Rhodovastum atsumiense]
MQGCIAVLNAGSSSIKFAIYDAGADAPARFRGQIQSIGLKPELLVRDRDGNEVLRGSWPADGFDHDAATQEILQAGQTLLRHEPVLAVGHRVVHGGLDHAAPVRVDPALIASLAKLAPLAPLHQPHNLAPIRTIAAQVPDLPQVACFDTAFHRCQAPVVQSFGLPRRFHDEGVRRYGFHGISYEYITSRLPDVAPAIARGRLVIGHLGNGASLCAVQDGRSVASTMGFTAVDGLLMGTRCGALDPGVLLYLMDTHGMDARAIEDLIYRRSGLLGVSGISPDMRSLRASAAPEAAEAIALFVHRIVREIGSMAAALGGIDALVFTGGIGENDAATRAEVARGCAWLGLTLDPERNAAGGGCISAEGSRVAAWVVATDEERMIARHTAALLGLAAGTERQQQEE